MAKNNLIEVENLSVFYQDHPVIAGVYLNIKPYQVTGIMGRSGCGKSTLLRCFNRLNDFVDGIKIQGRILIKNQNICSPDVDLVQLRRQVGMVFQKPAPFPTSIYKNIAMALKANGYKKDIGDMVESSLIKVGLWDEVKNYLHKNAMMLSGGQKQRLCIARAIAIQPEIILLDEPCSALDPISTLEIENLLYKLKRDYTIILTTHDLKQIARVCDEVVYMNLREDEQGHKTGFIVEQNSVEKIFLNPESQETLAYTTGGVMGKYKFY